MISILDLVLRLLNIALEAAHANEVSIEVVTGIQNAIAELEKVRGTPVTFGQLENLRIKSTW